MNDSIKNKVNLAITIRLPAQYGDTERMDGLKDAVGDYPSTLFDSLGLPLNAFIDVVSGSATDSAADDRVHIDMNGHTLRVTPFTSAKDNDVGPGGLHELVAHAIYRARRYAISDEVVRALWCNWLPDEEPPATNDARLRPFVEILTEAVRYGFSAARFGEYADRLAAPDATLLSAHTIVEEVLESVEKAGGCLFIASGLYAEYELSLDQTTTDENLEKTITEMLLMMSDGLFYELGLNYGLEVFEDQKLSPGCFRLKINDMQLPIMYGLGADEILVNDTVDHLTLLQLEGRPAINPANDSECAIVLDTDNNRDICEQSGLTTWGADGYLILGVSGEIRRMAGAFLTSAELHTDQLVLAFPDLVDCARRQLGMPAITRILRQLLDEEISIRDLRTILDGLLLVDGVTTADEGNTILFFPNTGIKFPSPDARLVGDLRTDELAECVRTVLKRHISHKYTRGGNTLVVYLLAPDIEELIRTSADPLPQADLDRIIEAVHAEVGPLVSSYQMPVILTTLDVRRRLRRIIEIDFPALAVLSYHELSPDLNIQPIARIGIDS